MTAIRYVLILALVFLPASPFATTFPVTKTADTNDGTCDPDCSLREAIDAANTNPGADDVSVPAGIYLLTIGELFVSDDVSIVGAGQTNTIIDGNATNRVLRIDNFLGVVEISGMTIQNGSALYGGGIFNDDSYITLINSTVSGNTASGVTPFGGGGGISNIGGGDLGHATLINSTVSGNTSDGVGGGIYLLGNLTLINSTVSGNTAGDGGGGVYNRGYATFTKSTVSRNIARWGGGIKNIGGNVTLTNSTVSGNTASSYGGGIYNGGGGYVSLTNTTVSGNTATGRFGGGISNCSPFYCYPVGGVAAENSIVAGNTAVSYYYDNCWGGVASLDYNLTDDTSCGFTALGDLVVADAMLGPLQDNDGPTETHYPMTGSPVIDAANNASCPATDQRGNARPFDGDDPPDGSADCDIGAVEYMPEPGSSVTLIAGAALLGALYRRRAPRLRLG
jgi:CSLREA domain-containing protein